LGCAADIGAIQTTTVCPTGSVIVGNGSFDAASLSPWAPYNGAARDTSSTFAGAAALKTNGSGSGAEQTVAVQPNTTYLLTGEARVTAAGDKVGVGVKSFGGTERSASTTTTGWQGVATTFTTGANATTAVIYCYQSGGAGAAYCDDIQLTKSVPVVSNGGFESQALGPWNAWNAGVTTSANAHSGSSAAVIGPNAGSVEQTIAVLPNTTYQLTGWGKTATNQPISIGVKNHGATEVSAIIGTTSYSQGAKTFTTGPTAYRATVYCYLPSGSASSYCDDISIVP
jgi:hypothetical protein